MQVRIEDLQLGDRFRAQDGEFWTVLSNDRETVTIVRKGRSYTGASSEQLVEVVNRDESLTELGAQQNLANGGLV